MSEDTSATTPEPGYDAEGDANQLSAEDTLADRDVADLLDEGYTVPDRDRPNHFGETALEELRGETLDQRLAEEEPEAWDVEERRDVGRAGRISADGDALDGRENDVYALDEGISGAAASAEEAALHVVDDELDDL